MKQKKESLHPGHPKELEIIKLFRLGEISANSAAKTLNLSRLQFLELLGKHKISIFPNESKQDLKEDLDNACFY